MAILILMIGSGVLFLVSVAAITMAIRLRKRRWQMIACGVIACCVLALAAVCWRAIDVRYNKDMYYPLAAAAMVVYEEQLHQTPPSLEALEQYGLFGLSEYAAGRRRRPGVEYLPSKTPGTIILIQLERFWLSADVAYVVEGDSTVRTIHEDGVASLLEEDNKLRAASGETLRWGESK